MQPDLTIKRKKLNTGYIWIVWSSGLLVAELHVLPVSEKVWTTSNIEVDEGYRRQGIATHLYDLAKKFLARKQARLVKSNNVTPDGELLWASGKI